MPPLDARHCPPVAAPAPSRWRATARQADERRADQRHTGAASPAADHPERGVFSQPRAQPAPASLPYPRRYPPESWGSPAPARRPPHPPQPAARPAPEPPRAAPAPPEPPAPLVGAVPSVESFVPAPAPDAPRRRASRRRADPSPSLLAYRLNRLWLTPLFRRGLTMGLPALVLAGAIALYLGDAQRRAALIGMASELRAGFEARPEFRVNSITVHTETPAVARAIENRLGIGFPVSSFHLDLPALRTRVEALDAVESAALRIGAGGVLEIRVIEREPAFVWRHRGGLSLIDAEGNRVALLTSRAARPDLPLIAGDGAPEAVDEARRLLAAAAPLGERLHALVRVGERRWDLVIAGDRRIMLPGSGAVSALDRVLALDNAPSDLLSRDVIAVDMRNPARPTIRLSQPAVTELHRIRSLDSGVRNR